MNYRYLSAITLALFSTVSVNATDLYQKSNVPVPPIRPIETNSYVGANIGAFGRHYSTPSFNTGIITGSQVYHNLDVELAYDYLSPNRYNHTENIITGNIKPKYKFNYLPLTVYGLAGVGYSFNVNDPVWTTGVGSQIVLTKNLDLDTRYRYIRSFSHHINQYHVITSGLNYKF